MKHLAKLLALLGATGGLLALMVLLCRHRKRRKPARYLTLYNYD